MSEWRGLHNQQFHQGTAAGEPALAWCDVCEAAPRRSGSHYEALCECGAPPILAPTLPKVWAAHDVHTSAARFLSRQRHPSGGGA